MDNTDLQTITLPASLDVYAPDGSEIRLLATARGGSMVHCTLPPGSASRAVAHSTVEELWYFLSGEGQVWRRLDNDEVIVEARPGVSLNIPTGAAFQFQNTGNQPLCFVIVTTPPWPGEFEAVPQTGIW
jgi:mannose-6-phosphate isomerase-like protein (cupin superfamily)